MESASSILGGGRSGYFINVELEQGLLCVPWFDSAGWRQAWFPAARVALLPAYAPHPQIPHHAAAVDAPAAASTVSVALSSTLHVRILEYVLCGTAFLCRLPVIRWPTTHPHLCGSRPSISPAKRLRPCRPGLQRRIESLQPRPPASEAASGHIPPAPYDLGRRRPQRRRPGRRRRPRLHGLRARIGPIRGGRPATRR